MLQPIGVWQSETHAATYRSVTVWNTCCNLSECDNLKQNEAQSACAESANKGVNKLSKDVTQTQQQRPELLTVTLTWRASKYKVHKFHQSYIHFGSVHVLLVDSMYLVFTRMPGLSYHRRLRSLLLCLCDVFRALINSLCVLILHERSGPCLRR